MKVSVLFVAVGRPVCRYCTVADRAIAWGEQRARVLMDQDTRREREDHNRTRHGNLLIFRRMEELGRYGEIHACTTLKITNEWRNISCMYVFKQIHVIPEGDQISTPRSM
jgi:hypothetical protein